MISHQYERELGVGLMINGQYSATIWHTRLRFRNAKIRNRAQRLIKNIVYTSIIKYIAMADSLITKAPRVGKYLTLAFPAPRVVLITMNRPSHLNAMNQDARRAFGLVWTWFDAEPNLSVATLTGTGRAFCAGADLKEGAHSHVGTPKRPDRRC